MMTLSRFGPLMLDIVGLALSAEERERLAHPLVGGVILFARNYVDPEQIAALIIEIRAIKAPLLIAVDQEGGRVQRFQNGLTRLPPAACYARESDLTLAESAGWLMAAELLALGVDISFAPVLDVDRGISVIIGDRAFASDPSSVIEYAAAFQRGMRSAGMAATGKHFPGHGAVALDSHLTLPVDERSFTEIEACDIQPFRALIAQGLEGVMMAHVHYAQVDAAPASFSRFWIDTVLRGSVGFDGAVFSDDLSMTGAAEIGDYPERARRALAAGCDMILLCNRPEAVDEVLDILPNDATPARDRRLAAMQGQGNYADWQTLQHSCVWQERRAKLLQFWERLEGQ